MRSTRPPSVVAGTLRTVKRRRDGSLEQAVLGVLAESAEPKSVSEVGAAVDSGLAYTSVATVLNRLVAKGHVRRERSGRSFRYAAAVSPSDLSALAMRRLLLEAANPRAAISGFVGALSPDEVAYLRSIMNGVSAGENLEAGEGGNPGDGVRLEAE